MFGTGVNNHLISSSESMTLLEDGLDAPNPLREASPDPPIDIPSTSDGLSFAPHEYKPVFGYLRKLAQKGTRDIPVLYPTSKNMQDFSAYIESIERKGVHLKSGIVKIVPPSDWMSKAKVHFKYETLAEMKINRVLGQKVQKVSSDSNGVYFQRNGYKTYNKEGITVGDFMLKAISTSLPKKYKTLDDIIGNFWSDIENQQNRPSSLYGADVEGTLFGDGINQFNMNKLGTLIDLAKESGMEIPGITTPYLYFGSFRTAFAWHTEDLDLYSLNYQHFGEPKIWYSIPSSVSARFERLCAQLYKPFGSACHSFMRHKICLTRPDILEKYKIPYGCIAQYPGEFIVTFPKGYHMGFNVGFNCNEAVNFAVSRWFGYALQANICDCNPEMAVRMNLREILSKYVENDNYKECFIREPAKKDERTKPALGISSQAREALPVLKRLLLFDSSFEEEIEYNQEQADISPFCCVCQYFTPRTNCQLKGPIRSSSKSPCYVSQQMLSKEQHASIGPYRPDKRSALRLPFAESPLRQCVNCKVAVHANCYSFIEDYPVEKQKVCSKNKPPEIVALKMPETVIVKQHPEPYNIKPIRIITKKSLADTNIEKEQSLSPVPKGRCLILKSKNVRVHSHQTSKTSSNNNNIFKKIMERVKAEEANPITVIKPIISSKKKVLEAKPEIPTEKRPSNFQAEEWLCDPCRLHKENLDLRQYICCEFCNLRGGALIRRKLPGIEEDSYVHVICSMVSRTTSIQRNGNGELIAHSLPPPRECSVLKKTSKKNVLPTVEGGRSRLCVTYSNNKPMFCGNLDDNFCGLCKESFHDVLVTCEKCHQECRRMEAYHPTCANLLGFQFCSRLYPDVLVAICPSHFDLSDNPKSDLKVGDTVVHNMNDGCKPLAEVVYIGSQHFEKVLSYQGEYLEIDKNQILICECRTLGCNGNHFPGYLIAVRHRGAIGITFGVFRGRRVERNFRIRHDDGLAFSCKRSELFSSRDPNCPPDCRRLLTKRRAEKDLLEKMNVPIKRERRMTSSDSRENSSSKNNPNPNTPTTFISMQAMQIKQEVIDDI